MTAEYLLDAIGRIDDKLVMEAAEPKRHTAVWTRWGALAAAAALCFGLFKLYPAMTAMRKGAAAPAAQEDMHEAGSTLSENSGSTDRYGAAQKEQEAAVVGDVCKPVFFIGGVIYRITDFADFLPDGCTPLGELGSLLRTAASDQFDPDAPKETQPLVNDETLVGHRAWLSADGTLFVETDGGSYAVCAATAS